MQDKKDFPAFFTLNGENIEDKTEISNTFNNCFASVGAKLSNSIEYNGTKTISSFLKQRFISSFNFECISTTDVEKIVKNLASKNSSDHDGISARFLKRILETVTLPLTHIINQSLCTGIFPDRLKIAKVVPLFKKGDQHILDNYRPISLLPVVYKVFEIVVFNQLYQYVTDNNLIFTSQYGFRKLLKYMAYMPCWTCMDFLSVQVIHMWHRNETNLKPKTHCLYYLEGDTIRLILNLFWN